MIDLGKAYKTKSGRSVRILCTDGPEELYPVVGIINGSCQGGCMSLIYKLLNSQQKFECTWLSETDVGILITLLEAAQDMRDAYFTDLQEMFKPRSMEELYEYCSEIETWDDLLKENI